MYGLKISKAGANIAFRSPSGHFIAPENAPPGHIDFGRMATFANFFYHRRFWR